MPSGRSPRKSARPLVGLLVVAGLLGACRRDAPAEREQPPAKVIPLLTELLPLQAQGQAEADRPQVVLDLTFDEGLGGARSSQLRAVEEGVVYLHGDAGPPTIDIPIGEDAGAVTVLEVAFAARSGTQGQLAWKRVGESDFVQPRTGPAVFAFGANYSEPLGRGYQHAHVFLEDDPGWTGQIETLRLTLTDAASPVAIDSVTLFRTRLRSRHVLEGGPLGLLRYRLGEESTEIAYAPTPWSLTKRLRIPERASLRFAYGLTRPDWLRGDAVRFRITATVDSAQRVLFEEVLDPEPNQPAAWQWTELDLGELAGQSVDVTFEAEAVGTERSIDALWGGPRLVIAGRQQAPNVLMICLDTLRADRLGFYGYPRPTSPNLDTLAAESIVFERAYSQVATTLESHASMFTGLYPTQHGIAHDMPLGPLAPTLAAALRHHGYTTIGFSDSGYTSDDFGLGAGFDRYHERYEHMKGLDDKIDRFLDWRESAPELPYFAFFHTYAVHSPYDPQPADRWRRFLDDYDGSLEVPVATEQLFDLLDGTRPWTEEDIAFVGALYDACIQSTDEKIGRLLDRLEESGELEKSVIVLVSDHGEGLGEHEMLLHGFDLHREQVHVPLLFRLPERWSEQRGLSPGRVGGFVELIDLPATILDLLGLPASQHLSELAEGRSLVPLMRGTGEARHGVIATVPWTVGAGSALRTHDTLFFEMTYRDDFELVAPSRRRNGPHLFDLESDPKALQNLAAEQEKRVDSARRSLDDLLEALRSRKADLHESSAHRTVLTDEMRARLKRMGYLGK